MPDKSVFGLDIILRDEKATQDLAKLLAPCLQPGDLVMLSGGLGTGKTAFARALIRVLCDDPLLDVPSPSFSLMQHYDSATFAIVHADLYRLQSPEDVIGIGLVEAAQECICIVEWPENGLVPWSSRQCHMTFSYDAHSPLPTNDTTRLVNIVVMASLKAQFYQALAVQQFLEISRWGNATRIVLQGDASSKIYERLLRSEKDNTTSASSDTPATAVLVIAPERAQPFLHGRSYSYADVAHLSTRLAPAFLVAQNLRAIGLSAPMLYAHDVNAGFALLEDFGSTLIAENGAPVPERYHTAIAVLAHLHAYDMPQTIAVPEIGTHTLALYDRDALLIEVEQFVEWYVPHHARLMLSARMREEFLSQWRLVIEDHVLDVPSVWTLRDYHSPNLFWLPEREGLAKIGLIDLQDTVLGHAAYDVVSLCQDARVTIDETLELDLLGTYIRARAEQDAQFDVNAFAKAYMVLGAQRALKILGVFVRLDKRDGKPQYLAHLPRVKNYLIRNLRHPALAPVQAWFESVPNIFS